MTKISYAIKLETENANGKRTALYMLDLDDADLEGQHPKDLFSEVFRASVMEAAVALQQPGVTDVPVFELGRLAPIAYLRNPHADPTNH